jgi:hypothetical protein
LRHLLNFFFKAFHSLLFHFGKFLECSSNLSERAQPDNWVCKSLHEMDLGEWVHNIVLHIGDAARELSHGLLLQNPDSSEHQDLVAGEQLLEMEHWN